MQVPTFKQSMYHDELFSVIKHNIILVRIKVDPFLWLACDALPMTVAFDLWPMPLSQTWLIQ